MMADSVVAVRPGGLAMTFPPASTPSTPPTELAVVGEHKDDPDHLLLLGADGAYYAYSMPSGETRPIEPDEDWTMESTSPQELFT